MTKLEPAGEPSMEEILASIRRIIAEDPPGSRPAPETSSNSKGSANPLPADASQPAAPASDPVFSGRPKDLMATPRMSPTGKREAEATFGESPEPVTSLGIDAQLADVLGSPRNGSAIAPTASEPVVATSPVPPAGKPTATPFSTGASSTAASVQAALDSLLPSQSAAARTPGDAPQPAPARPGFSFSRDGYIPPAGTATAKSADGEADPFDFKLGPSPFARAQMASDPAPQPEAPADSKSDPFGTIIPTRDVMQMRNEGEAAASARSASAPFGTLGEAPATRVQPDFSAMSSLPETSPTATHEPAPASPFRAAFEPSPAPASAPASTPAFGPSSLTAKAASPAFEPRPAPAAAQPEPAPLPAAFIPSVGLPHASLGSVPTAAPSTFKPALGSALGEIATPRALSFETDAAVEAAPPQAPAAAPISTAPILTASTFTTPTFTTPGPASQAASSKPASATAAPAGSTASMPEAEAVVKVEPEIEPAKETAAQNTQAVTIADHMASVRNEEAVFEEALNGEEDVAAPAASSPVAPRALISARPHQERQDEAAANRQDIANGRTMEDTVVDLLRPMLRTWLAENMPRIVERALRKELEDSSRSEHKPAAE